MSLLKIVLRSLRQHMLSTVITAFSIALASGLLISVWVVKDQARENFTGVDSGFDGVFGARGSKLQLVLADEPTGNLDPASAAESLGLIRETCQENGAALLLVSHDRGVLGQFDNVRDLAEINRAAAWPSAKEAKP